LHNSANQRKRKKLRGKGKKGGEKKEICEGIKELREGN